MSTPHPAAIRIATTDGVAGARVTTSLGVVVGIAIRSRGVGGNIMAGLDALGNGSALAEYRDTLTACRVEALSRMVRAAEELGANAVVGVRFDTAEVGREMVEVVAYGTAAVLQDVEPTPDQEMHRPVRATGESETPLTDIHARAF
jgi:uncharacterized protein YbjQ (UPF0145 family)